MLWTDENTKDYQTKPPECMSYLIKHSLLKFSQSPDFLVSKVSVNGQRFAQKSAENALLRKISSPQN